MHFNHSDMYNHLLTGKCSCGGEPEMLIDFGDYFEVRCSKCHLSTRAYIKPEDAAKHWNDGDDIMDEPLHIFWDDPEGYLKGEVAAVHVSDDGFWGVSYQSCDFDKAVFEYKDKMISFEHEISGEDGAINIGRLSSSNPEVYRHIVRPVDGESIHFEKIIYSENGDIEGIAFRWSDTWLFVFTSEHNLILTRSSFDLSDDSSWTEVPVEPTLFS